MPRPYKLTIQEREDIIEKFKNGANMTNLSLQYLIDRTSVRRLLIKVGLYKESKPKNTKKRIWVTMKNRNERLKKDLYLWHDDDKKMPLSYEEYAKRKGINLKKYFSSHSLTKEEKFNNQSGAKFF